MKTIPFLIVLIALVSCKKHSADKIYTIEGQVLESTSNPIPVTDYAIYFSQKSNSGLFGGVYGLENTVKTGLDGKFKFQYNPTKNYGLSVGGTNPNEIYIYGIDSIKYNRIGSVWYPITSSIDTNLNTVYLFKKIQTLVRKVQFNNSLNVGETLNVITPDSSGSSHKLITGPISAGTIYIVDTIRNCKLSMFNLLTKEYNFTITLTKPSYLTYLSILMPQGDELFREVLITY